MKPVVTPRIAARSSFAMPIVLAVALSSAPATVAALDHGSPASRGWSVPLNGSLSSPSVVDGTVYVGTRDGILFAFGAGTGSRRWQYQTGATLPAGGSPILVPQGATGAQQLGAAVAADDTGLAEIRANPVVHKGMVLIKSLDGNLYGLDAASGEKRWSLKVSDKGSPVAANGALYLVTVLDKGTTSLRAIDVLSGKDRWAFEARLLQGVDIAGDRVYVTSRRVGDGESVKPHLYAMDAATGSLAWKVPLERDEISRPICVSSVIYVATYDDYKVDDSKDKRASTLYAIDQAEGRVLWKADAPGEPAYGPSPVLLSRDGVLFVTHGEIDALDPKSGALHWKFAVKEVQDVFADDVAVYVGSLGKMGMRTIQAVGQTEGRTIWKKALVDGYGRIQGVDGGAVFYDTYFDNAGRSTLYAVDTATGKEKWSRKLLTSVSAHGALSDGLLFVPTTPEHQTPDTVKPGSFLAIDVRDGSVKP